MKLYILFILLTFSCCTFGKHSDVNQQETETILIKSNYKIANHGYLTFLFLKNGKPFKKKVYAYDIDKKNGNVHIGLLQLDHIDSEFNFKGFSDHRQWNKKQKGTYREKLFYQIDEHFLSLSNKEKLNLLDSFTQNH